MCTDEQRVPAGRDLGVIAPQCEMAAQMFEVGGGIDRADLVLAVRRVHRETLAELVDRIVRIGRPVREGPIEIDVDHDPAEIEQQRLNGFRPGRYRYTLWLTHANLILHTTNIDDS